MNGDFRHFTKRDKSDLRKAKTFEDLAVIALRVLKRMHQTERKRAHPRNIGMVSGPISTGGLGSPDANIKAMRKTIRKLEQKGYCVFNQLPFEDPMWKIIKTPYYQGELHLLTKFYRPIFKSGFITIIHVMLNWNTSFGATWEHKETKRFRIKQNHLTQ
ncbi:DUF4406 domain-containing protein [Patescibacteria group bacterium]|nr:DUF4406 domain-containing protein [Patescibacteria group bacterium]